eukprot:536206_1
MNGTDSKEKKQSKPPPIPFKSIKISLTSLPRISALNKRGGSLSYGIQTDKQSDLSQSHIIKSHHIHVSGMTSDNTSVTKKSFTVSSAWPSNNEGMRYMTYHSVPNIGVDEYLSHNPQLSQNESIKQHSKNNYRNQCCLGDVTKCRSLFRLIETMDKYKHNMDDSKSNDECIDEIEIHVIINDFLHLMSTHNQNDEQFEKIANIFGNCNISKCKIFRRNHRERTKFNDSSILHDLYDTVNTNCIHKYQILDKIHCFYQHCYDIGNRLLMREKLIINHCNYKENCDEKIEGIQCTKNAKINKLCQILSNKRKIYENMQGVNITETLYQKYNQLSIAHDYQNMYIFGCEYRYKGTGEEKETEYEAIIIMKTYATFKEELTNNIIKTITMT